MKWVTPNFSREKVRQSGQVLRTAGSTSEDLDCAMEVLSNWRAVHAYPMHCILIVLRRLATKADEHAVIVQRLKRQFSIVKKLERFSSMSLSRMQDIAGCRAVVGKVSQVEKLFKSLKASRTKHKLHKVNDYISEPKSSGYRGIHLVYKYNGDKKAYKDLFVEVQLRSRIQHSWATAVEIVDSFTNQALKASQGDKKWARFFRVLSAEFAKLESRSVGKDMEGVDTLQEARKLAKTLSVFDRLDSFAVITHIIAEDKIHKNDFYILELEEKEGSIKVWRYPAGAFESATEKYLEFEKKALLTSEYDVVLVSASTIHTLKVAYPNYFADSKEFIKHLKKVLES